MAGEWIKMRGNLWDDPRVSRICDLTDRGEAEVIGSLYWLWASADQHTEDGVMPGLTLRQIDRKTGVPGFASALIEIGWLIDDPKGVVIVNFEEHNGASAKRRCMEAKRKASTRNVSASHADNEQTNPGQDAPETGHHAELEKRREEESSSLRSEDSRAPRSLSVSDLVKAGIPEPVARDWLAVRKAKKQPLTETAFDAVKRESVKAGMELSAAILVCAERGWVGFKAEWLTQARQNAPNGQTQAGQGGGSQAPIVGPQIAQTRTYLAAQTITETDRAAAIAAAQQLKATRAQMAQ